MRRKYVREQQPEKLMRGERLKRQEMCIEMSEVDEASPPLMMARAVQKKLPSQTPCFYVLRLW